MSKIIGRCAQRGDYVITRVGAGRVKLRKIYGDCITVICTDIGTATAARFGFDVNDSDVAAVFEGHETAFVQRYMG